MANKVFNIRLMLNGELDRWEILTHDFFTGTGKRRKNPLVFSSNQNEAQARASCNIERIKAEIMKRMPDAQDVHLDFHDGLRPELGQSIASAGIQNGMNAGEGIAREADQKIRTLVPEVWTKFCLENPQKTLGFTHGMRLPKQEWSIGCEPDGGIIFDVNGVPIIAFESKKQGAVGNAIERWYKNFRLLTFANRDIHYVTTLVGTGAGRDLGGKPFGALGMCLSELKMQTKERGREFLLNVCNGAGTSFFIKQELFTNDELEQIVLSTFKRYFRQT
jgi:hypothetical protein